ncbi:MAG: hypothetical protein JNN27_03495 [Planctomycetes bacterium]|nr:hypothetical protein [Planctomycetota bacterium]
MARKSKISTTTNPDLTLSSLCEAYLASLAERGQSEGTIFSYRMELNTAKAVLGADTLVSDLTYDAIAAFNTCDRVMKKKTGKPKAEPSFLKTRRTLRLCLAFGEQSGLIAKSPVDARKDVLPGATGDATTPEPEKPKKGKRRGALVLEVSQPEAEAAADVAEAMFAAPETAA